MGLGSVIKKWKGTTAGAVAAPFTGGISLAVGGAYDLMKHQAEAQNKANQRAVDRANAYDMYTWDLANQYNNPRAQAQRLIDAGFNPYTQGAVSAGNATSTAGSNGVASQEAFGGGAFLNKGLAVAQQGANLLSTYENIKNGQATRDYTAMQEKALDHNLTWAKDHDLPVGQQQNSWENDAWNIGKNWWNNNNPIDIIKNWWNNKSEQGKSYADKNKDRSTWDLVKEQAKDMYARYKFW